MKRPSGLISWAVRAVWISLPFTVGPALSVSLESHSRTVGLVALTLSWAVWGSGLVATLLAHPVGCTGLRVISVGVLGVACWAAIVVDGRILSRMAAIGASLALLFVVGSASFGEWCVNGPAYPNERRFLLRPSAALLVGPVPIAAVFLNVGMVAGPLLLASRAWVLGSISILLGWPLVWLLSRALWALSRRFVVFVPAGFVLHDFSVLREPVLFPKRVIEIIRAAPNGTDALDLTNGAPGLALEAVLLEKVEVTLLDVRKKTATPGATARFIFTPSRPGRVLVEAKARRLA